MVKPLSCLPAALSLSVPAVAKELSEVDFLAELPVVLTSSRLAQSTQDAPNAISVIDRAMIEASGFVNLADLFRLVPGFYIGQNNGYNFSVANAISSDYARHMQVLVDGRSIYLASLGGVRWDTVPLNIADIDRIEVVRGPNAAGYGANALTGIINIITRHPAEVEGRMVSATIGANKRQDYLFRWAGGDANKHRVSVSWHQDQGFPALYDSSHGPAFNYYGDYDLGAGQVVSVQLGYLDGVRDAGDSYNPVSREHDERIDSSFQQLDYRKPLGEGRELLAKVYHNHLLGKETVPVVYPGIVPGTTYARDLESERWHGETQLNLSLSQTARMTLGGYGRRDLVNSEHYFHTSEDLVTWSWGAFTHAEWRPHPNWLVNAGVMWESHDLGGTAVSPRVALSWQPHPRHTVRIGVSRANRNPVQAEANADWRFDLPLVGGGTTTITRLASNSAIQPETNLSREIGYVGNWPEYDLGFDLRIYRDRLKNLIDVQSGTRYMSNVADSTHKGLDAQLSWKPAAHTFVVLNYAQLHIDTTHPQSQYFPEQVVALLLSHRVGNGVDLSLSHYRSDAFVSYDKNRPPKYRRVDFRIAKEFKLEGHKASLAYVLQHADGADYEYDPQNFKSASRQSIFRFQMEF